MGSLVDLTGLRFGRLVVTQRSNYNDVYDKPLWDCKCNCGGKTTTRGWSLRSKATRSCGCLQRTARRFEKHGLAHTGHQDLKYKMYHNAKTRAKRDGLPFNIELEDIRIPKYCPVFRRLRLVQTNTTPKNNSPSLDKLKPELGYIKGNIQVISYKANTIKQRATYRELFRVATWLKKEIINVRIAPKTNRMPRRNSQ